MMRMPLLAGFALALALTGCDKKTSPPTAESSRPEVAVAAWVRLAARPDLPASGYFEANTKGEVGPLESVSAPAARVEMHESMTTADHMSSMKPIGSAAAENDKLAFEPGGKHLMLYGLSPALKRGGTLPLTFQFRGLPPVTVQAELVGPGDPAPSDED
jgi:copper(I)-binding protein